MSLLRTLADMSKNDVLRLSELKRVIYPLFRYIIRNMDGISARLRDKYGVDVLDDLNGMKEYDKIKLYVRYHYGKHVDLSDLRSRHRTIYNYISKMGSHLNILSGMGFIVSYKAKHDFGFLIDILKGTAEKGTLYTMSQSNYNRLYYQACKEKITVEQLLAKHGLRRVYQKTERKPEDIV